MCIYGNVEMRFILAVCFSFLSFSNVFAGVVLNEVPEEIPPDAKYLFYSHGYIVEGENPKPVHPILGVNDYPAILDALANLNAIVISEHRAANSSPFKHAEKLKHQVNTLIEKGVSPRNI